MTIDPPHGSVAEQDDYAEEVALWLRTTYRVRPPEEAIAEHLTLLRGATPAVSKGRPLQYRAAFVAACLLLVASATLFVAGDGAGDPITTDTVMESPATAADLEPSDANQADRTDTRSTIPARIGPVAATVRAGGATRTGGDNPAATATSPGVEQTALSSEEAGRPADTAAAETPAPTATSEDTTSEGTTAENTTSEGSTSESATPETIGSTSTSTEAQISTIVRSPSSAIPQPQPTTTEPPQTSTTGNGTDPGDIDGPTCNGLAATIVAGNGNQTIHGTDGPDVIVGGNGKDIIYGHGGNDVICGGNGMDRLYGGAGDDVLIGGTGPDKLVGGSGNDELVQ